MTFPPTTPRRRSIFVPCRRSCTAHSSQARTSSYPWQVHVYQKAAQVGSVLYQLPCNCRCDRALGHTSLRSCYETTHATECSTCAQEGFYAYYKTKAGWTPAQIRAGIARHDYESIDLDKQ